MRTLLLLMGFVFSNFNVHAKSIESPDLVRTAIATREAINKDHDMSNIFEVNKAAVVIDGVDYPCISIVISRKVNDICPDDPTVGPFLEVTSTTCFESDNQVLMTMLTESQC